MAAPAESSERVTLVLTDRTGYIVEMNTAATSLLNFSRRGLVSRPRTLVVFFDRSRDAILAAQRSAGPLISDPIPASLRPLGRGPRPVSARVRELPDGSREWTILPTQGA